MDRLFLFLLGEEIPLVDVFPDQAFQIIGKGAVIQFGGLHGQGLDLGMNSEAGQDFRRRFLFLRGVRFRHACCLRGFLQDVNNRIA